MIKKKINYLSDLLYIILCVLIIHPRFKSLKNNTVLYNVSQSKSVSKLTHHKEKREKMWEKCISLNVLQVPLQGEVNEPMAN